MFPKVQLLQLLGRVVLQDVLEGEVSLRVVRLVRVRVGGAEVQVFQQDEALAREAMARDLPSTPAAKREIGLAVARMGPTCQTFVVAVSGFLTAETVRYGETIASATAAIGAGVLPIPPAN